MVHNCTIKKNYIFFEDCQERTEADLCFHIKNREACLITNDHSSNFAGPCVWGKAHKKDFSCQSIEWMKKKGFTDYEECLELGKEL